MATFKAEIKGLQQVRARVEKVSQALSTGVDGILSEGAHNIAELARSNAPMGASGKLKASISADVSEKWNKIVSANAPYAAYVEFGTGSHVFENKRGFDFAPEVKEFAKEFYVNGQGKQMARPFLFPALEREKVRIIQNIKQLFDL